MGTGSRPEWAIRLGRLRADRGWSRRDLAERIAAAADRLGETQVPDVRTLIRYSRRWEAGEVEPTRYAALLADVYGAPDLAPARWLLADPEDAERLHRAATGRHEPAAVTALAGTLATYRQLEDDAGAAALIAPTLGLIELIDHIGPGVDSTTRPRLTGLAAEGAQFAAWLHQDAGRPAAADPWFDRALAAAVEAGDRRLVASVLSMRAQHESSRRDAGRAVQLAQAAQREARRLSPGVLSLAVHQEARALALAGDGPAALRSIDRADALGERAAERLEDEPPWTYFDSEPYRAVRRGIVLDQVGRHAEGADLIAAGIERLPRAMRRDRARYLPLLALALAAPTRPADADPVRAAAVAAEAVPLAVATRSAQAGRDLRRARRALDRWAGTPAVVDLDERLRAAGIDPAEPVPAGA